MGNIGPGELVVIFFVGLIVLGPTKLPEVARQVAQLLGELRRMSNSFQQELQDAMSSPPAATPEPAISEIPVPSVEDTPESEQLDEATEAEDTP
jgi:Tat protein translocase TatB subunit